MSRVRVLIVDDHPLLREGLRELISAEPDLEVCAEAGDAGGAIAAVEGVRPDVAVLDVTLGDDDGVTLVDALHERWPGVRILVLSMHDENLYAQRLIALGAHGYVMKREPPEVFLGALRRVAAGEHYVSPRLATRLLGRLAQARAPSSRTADGLTVREREVLREVARGLSTQQIAAALGMSAKTVDSHRRNIREKLGLGSAGDLVRYAVQWEADAARRHAAA